MKIAFFTDTYYPQPNGVTTSVNHLAQALRQKGHTVYIFAPKIKGYKDLDPDVHRIPSIRALPNLPDSIRIPLPISHKPLLKFFRLDFDLAHAHGNGLFSLLGLGVARAKKKPYILTFHTQISKYSHYFLNGKVLKPKHLNNILLKRFGNISDGVMTPSEKMRSELIAAGVKKDIAVIPNFINFQKFKIKNGHFLRKRLHIPTQTPILLSVGRLGKEKNFEFLLEVFQKVMHVQPDAHLVIVGEGVDFSKLKKLGQKLNLSQRFHLTGAILIDDMPKVYADSDIFVFPSDTETQGMCVLEAAASSLPLVVPRDQAYKGLIVNGKNGYTLPLKRDLFVKKIVWLLKNPDLVKRMGKNSAELVSKNFDPDKITNKLIRFYQQMIKG
ncbi:glycosyltransferase [Candidatus Daviesbacteria bacterium]|nr:glycosyltransferase [Candidatus Daviesbacteria bacterium]